MLQNVPSNVAVLGQALLKAALAGLVRAPTEGRAPVAMQTTPRVNVFGTPYARSDCVLHSSARCVSSVGRASRFNKQQVDFVFGKRAMLNTFWNDIEVAWPGTHVAVTEFDDQAAI